MGLRKTLYVAGFVVASVSYIFNVLAFTAQFDVFRWSVFAVVFLAVFFVFERFVDNGIEAVVEGYIRGS